MMVTYMVPVAGSPPQWASRSLGSLPQLAMGLSSCMSSAGDSGAREMDRQGTVF